MIIISNNKCVDGHIFAFGCHGKPGFYTFTFPDLPLLSHAANSCCFSQ